MKLGRNVLSQVNRRDKPLVGEISSEISQVVERRCAKCSDESEGIALAVAQ